MKVVNQTKCTVVGKTSREYTKNDGSKGVSCELAILQNGQVANLPCTEEVYNDVLTDPAMPLDVDVIFATSYDETYKKFRFDKVLQSATIGASNKTASAK